MAFGHRCSKVSVGTGFVSISMMFSLDSTGSMVICLEATCSQKKWYFTFMCLVHGFMAGELANVRVALLSSNSLHLTVGWDHSLINPFLIIRHRYSASHMDSTISVWSCCWLDTELANTDKERSVVVVKGVLLLFINFKSKLVQSKE
jgi:hypothetical protein